MGYRMMGSEIPMLGRVLVCGLLAFAQETPNRGFSVKVAVESVFLNVGVLDRNTNRSIAGLTKDDFLVYEDGVLQRVVQFQPSEAPLNLLLLLDVSGSTGVFLPLMKTATIDFTRSLKVNDRIAIAAFSSRIDLLQTFTDNRTRAETAIRRIWAGGGTSFYDALMTCLTDYLRPVEGRSAVVVFTDGIDNRLEGGYPAGSQTTFDELYRAVQEAAPVIYTIFLDTIGVGAPSSAKTSDASGASKPRSNPTLNRETSRPEWEVPRSEFAGYDLAARQLQMIADQTGGRMYMPRKIDELARIYADVAGDLRIQYQLGYNPSNSARDDRWREIGVKVRNHPEAVVRTRKGYYPVKKAGE